MSNEVAWQITGMYNLFMLQWAFFTIATIIAYIGLDYFIKQASGKIDDFLGGAIINFFALLPPLLIYLYLKLTNKDILITSEGVRSSMLAGLFIGIGTITFIKMFSTGVNLSLGSPIVRIGTIIGVTLIGVLVLKETLSPRQLAGLILSIVGLGLILLK